MSPDGNYFVDEPCYPLNIMQELSDQEAEHAGPEEIWSFRIHLTGLIRSGLFPGRHWQIFRLRFIRHLQPEAIARETGLSRNTVCKEIDHIRRILKKHRLQLFLGEPERKPAVLPAPVLRTGQDVLIDDLEFSIRTYNCLKRAGIHTLSDLQEKGMDGLMQVRHLGRRSLEEITQTLLTRWCIRLQPGTSHSRSMKKRRNCL